MDIAEKIRKIEALIDGAKSEGEKEAAKRAKERLVKRPEEPATEWSIHCGSIWQKKLFVAIAKKHGYTTYRYARQKYTTAMIRIGAHFLDNVLYPEYLRYSRMFTELVDGILLDLINKIYCIEDEDDVVIAGALPPAHSS